MNQTDTNPIHNRYVNISGYRFVNLDLLPVLQADMLEALTELKVLGTVLLAQEGINVALVGTEQQITAVESYFQADTRFSAMEFKKSRSDKIPFSKLKVRIRHEIIAFDGEDARDRHLLRQRAPALSPEQLEDWIVQGRPFTLLDTRNAYEIESGTFTGATHLNIAHFRDFKQAVKQAVAEQKLDTDVPVVTFCTGGIRCEKAAPWMMEAGFSEVYQIEGGIIKYLEKTSGRFWQGQCFVFDDRVELDKELRPTGASWCNECQLTVAPNKSCRCQLSTTAIDTV